MAGKGRHLIGTVSKGMTTPSSLGDANTCPPPANKSRERECEAREHSVIAIPGTDRRAYLQWSRDESALIGVASAAADSMSAGCPSVPRTPIIGISLMPQVATRYHSSTTILCVGCSAPCAVDHSFTCNTESLALRIYNLSRTQTRFAACSRCLVRFR